MNNKKITKKDMQKQDIRNYLYHYGRDLRKARKRNKYTQLQVAHEIGCSQAIISHIECGYMLPPTHIEQTPLALYN